MEKKKIIGTLWFTLHRSCCGIHLIHLRPVTCCCWCVVPWCVAALLLCFCAQDTQKKNKFEQKNKFFDGESNPGLHRDRVEY